MPSTFQITRQTFTDIENFISDNEASADKVLMGMDALARSMILVIKGLAQQKSAGPQSFGRSNPAFANRIPVQRISGRYYAGWTTRKVGNAHWMLYNDAVEAYLIETGLYQRTRRPILKLSIIGMLKFLENSRTEQRFLAWVLAPRRAANGQYAAIPIQQRLQGTATLGGLAGPSGTLPG